MTDPIPCPFCGSDQVITESSYVTDHFIKCVNCTARKGPYPDIETAIDEWNRRT